MIDTIYQFLDRLGYNHPLHPPLTHMPEGLVVGALFFAGVAWLFRRSGLALTARHCLILALIFFFPTVLAGYMDWQHFYAGAWLTIFKMKLALSGILLVLLSLSFILGRQEPQRYVVLLPLYILCFLTVVGLGYLGGQLVLGEKCPPASAGKFVAGAKIYKTNCGACHPQGGNIINPKLPLRKSPQLANQDTFLTFVRNPVRPDGSRGQMPGFSPARISDQELQELYSYIVNVLKTPKRR